MIAILIISSSKSNLFKTFVNASRNGVKILFHSF